ncbi:MAG: HAD family hydrolase [Gemmatimonadetes bacterium]|nr:HAD family hydrolase [Gemmatimonadota bacterium]
MTSSDETPERQRPAVFLDRDGTLIEDRHYLSDPAAVRLFDGAAEAVRRLKEAGYAVVLVTNQSGIGRGYFTEKDYRAVHRELCHQLASQGADLDGAYHCPDAPGVAGEGTTCRKPSPVLYRRAEGELGLDLRRSWFVGDKVSDVEAAELLGGRGVLVRTGYGREESSKAPQGCAIFYDMA